jgi:branched-chain amino acid transport system substrate-binding protein
MINKKRVISYLVVLLIIAFVPISVFAGAQEESEVVKVGFIGPLTGPNAAQGVGARNSFDLAIQQANASGEFSYTIEMVSMDDASNPGTGASVAMKLVADSDLVIASGHWNSPVARATIPIFKDSEIPLVIWGAIGSDLTSPENYPIVTRVCPTEVQENLPLAKFMMDDMGIKRWAIISDTSSYGKGNTKAWQDEAASRSGVEIISVDEVQVGQTDFKAILSKIKDMKPDAVYFGGVVMEGALIRRQMNDVGMGSTMMAAISGMWDDKFIEVATPALAEGVVVTKPGIALSKAPMGQDFIAAYEAAGFREPYGAYGPYAYDAAQVILDALKQVGPDSAKLIDTVVNIESEGLFGKTSFNEFGQTENIAVTVYIVDDGKWVDYDNSSYFSGKKSF